MEKLFNIVMKLLRMKKLVFGDFSFTGHLDLSIFKSTLDKFNIEKVSVSRIHFKIISEYNTYIVMEVKTSFVRPVRKHTTLTPVNFLGIPLYSKKKVITDFQEIQEYLESSNVKFNIGFDQFLTSDNAFVIYHAESGKTEEISKNKFKKLQYIKKRSYLNKRTEKTSKKIQTLLKK